MFRFPRALLLLMLLCQISFAQDILLPVKVDGETFTKKFVGNPPNGDRLLEFVRDKESFENWTKLVSYRYQQLPGIGNDPIRYASFMGQIVKQANPQANYQILKNEKTNEAIIDFITWPNDKKYMEFSVFRFWKATDGNAVFSLQFAYRFDPPKSPSQDNVNDYEQKKKEIRERRQSWIKQVTESDTKQVETTLFGQ